MQAVLDEIIGRASALTSEKRRELIRLLQDQEITKQAEERAKKSKVSNKSFSIHPNTVWMKENSHKYKGLYVAVYDGELIEG